MLRPVRINHVHYHPRGSCLATERQEPNSECEVELESNLASGKSCESACRVLTCRQVLASRTSSFLSATVCPSFFVLQFPRNLRRYGGFRFRNGGPYSDSLQSTEKSSSLFEVEASILACLFFFLRLLSLAFFVGFVLLFILLGLHRATSLVVVGPLHGRRSFLLDMGPGLVRDCLDLTVAANFVRLAVQAIEHAVLIFVVCEQ